jgi:hypothetical protein
MKLNLFISSLLLLSFNAWSGSYAYLCVKGSSAPFGLGGQERKCETVKLEETFDKECRTESEITFRTQGEYLDDSRDRNDIPLRSGVQEPYLGEVGIQGGSKSLSLARFLVFRRTNRSNFTYLSGCAQFSSQGKNWVDRHQLKLLKRAGNKYLFEVLQNTEHRAFVSIEDLGNYKILKFTDARGVLAGAPLLGVKTCNLYYSP